MTAAGPDPRRRERRCAQQEDARKAPGLVGHGAVRHVRQRRGCRYAIDAAAEWVPLPRRPMRRPFSAPTMCWAVWVTTAAASTPMACWANADASLPSSPQPRSVSLSGAPIPCAQATVMRHGRIRQTISCWRFRAKPCRTWGALRPEANTGAGADRCQRWSCPVAWKSPILLPVDSSTTLFLPIAARDLAWSGICVRFHRCQLHAPSRCPDAWIPYPARQPGERLHSNFGCREPGVRAGCTSRREGGGASPVTRGYATLRGGAVAGGGELRPLVARGLRDATVRALWRWHGRCCFRGRKSTKPIRCCCVDGVPAGIGVSKRDPDKAWILLDDADRHWEGGGAIEQFTRILYDMDEKAKSPAFASGAIAAFYRRWPALLALVADQSSAVADPKVCSTPPKSASCRILHRTSPAKVMGNGRRYEALGDTPRMLEHMRKAVAQEGHMRRPATAIC